MNLLSGIWRIAKVCKDTKVNDYPKDRVSSMEKQIKTSIESYLVQNNSTLEDYLSGLKISEEDYVAQIETTSKQDVANQLVYNAIAQAENIEVTDEELLKETRGIVQGMSGSPILQNGRLIGAVTHVFVNNPTKGYGIFIENMLKCKQKIKRMCRYVTCFCMFLRQ